MNCSYPDIQMLELIHNDRLELMRDNLPAKWEFFMGDMSGKGLRAYILIELMKVNEQLRTEPEEFKLRRLQGKADVWKSLLRLMDPKEGRKLANTIADYVKQITSTKESK